MKLPTIPTHRPLYAKKVVINTHNKIDKIVAETGVSKWVVIDKLLSSALGVRTKNKLDLSK